MPEPSFNCPECDHSPFPTVRGLKGHMSREHGGWSPEQIAEATHNNNEGIHVTGEQSLESALANLPLSENDQEVNINSDGSVSEHPQQTAAERKAAKEARKRIKARFDSLKEKISKDIPQQAFKFGGMEIDEAEGKWLQESIETTFEVFGVEFEVEPKNMTIRNPWIILLYPLIVIAYITISKIIRIKEEETNEQPQK